MSTATAVTWRQYPRPAVSTYYSFAANATRILPRSTLMKSISTGFRSVSRESANKMRGVAEVDIAIDRARLGDTAPVKWHQLTTGFLPFYRPAHPFSPSYCKAAPWKPLSRCHTSLEHYAQLAFIGLIQESAILPEVVVKTRQLLQKYYKQRKMHYLLVKKITEKQWRGKQFKCEGSIFPALSAWKKLGLCPPPLHTMSPINLCRCGSLVGFTQYYYCKCRYLRMKLSVTLLPTQ